MSTQPIITTPGKYRTRSGEVAEITHVDRGLGFGSLRGRDYYWFLSGLWGGLNVGFDITEKIDGGAE